MTFMMTSHNNRLVDNDDILRMNFHVLEIQAESIVTTRDPLLFVFFVCLTDKTALIPPDHRTDLEGTEKTCSYAYGAYRYAHVPD